MSWISSLTSRTRATISAIVLPAEFTCCEPLETFSTLVWIRSLISRAACALRLASAPTSPATTAKPRPCSPARAASTAAFSASRFVWKAISSITAMISAIRCEFCWISCIVATTRCTSLPPCSATVAAPVARSLALRAASAFSLTVLFSSSIAEAVSSSEPACCSVRWPRSCVPSSISRDCTSTSSDERRVSSMICDRR